MLWFNPAISQELKAVEFEAHYWGHRLQVMITPDVLRLGTIPSDVAPIRVAFATR